MNKYIAEFVGTFFLSLTIVLCANNGTADFAPVAIGMVLMVLVYSLRHISGAHFNPAVTIAIWLFGKCQSSEVLPYVVSQILAGVLAALTAVYLLDYGGENIIVETKLLPSTLRVVTAEFLGTFVLVLVIFFVAVSQDTEGNQYYGASIGFTVTAIIFAFDFISGAVFNPAVAFALAVAEMLEWSDIWIFMLSTLLGGIAAKYAFKYLSS